MSQLLYADISGMSEKNSNLRSLHKCAIVTVVPHSRRTVPPSCFQVDSWSTLSTANSRGICGPRIPQHPPTVHLSANISPTQCGFKRTGALKSELGSSYLHDVSRRESERERGEQHWRTEFIQYYWDIYSLADRYGEPPIPAPVSDAALRHTLIQLHWGGDALSASRI